MQTALDNMSNILILFELWDLWDTHNKWESKEGYSQSSFELLSQSDVLRNDKI